MKLRITVEGREYDVDVDVPSAAFASNGHRPAAQTAIPKSVLRPRPPQKLPEDSVCRSPIAGRIVAVVAAEGQAVRRNQPVVVIEAMKMEIPIGPAVDGTVKTILVGAGDAVSSRQALFELS